MSGQATPLRGMIFVDFWNYELSMKALEPGFRTDWAKLPQIIIQEMSALTNVAVNYERCFVFGSYDKNSPNDKKLYTWANNILAPMPGIEVRFFPRQERKTGPRCTGIDHHEIRECPLCGASMLGTQEKGVDTQIVIEMFDNAYSGKCDICTLVSADKDFAPAINAIMAKGIKIIHGRISYYGSSLTKECWGNIDLFKIKDQFRR